MPAVDLKVLHAKIGELTLEKDILSGALNSAGLAERAGQNILLQRKRGPGALWPTG